MSFANLLKYPTQMFTPFLPSNLDEYLAYLDSRCSVANLEMVYQKDKATLTLSDDGNQFFEHEFDCHDEDAMQWFDCRVRDELCYYIINKILTVATVEGLSPAVSAVPRRNTGRPTKVSHKQRKFAPYPGDYSESEWGTTMDQLESFGKKLQGDE